MADPLTAASIATLIFTTAVGKTTEALTEDARKALGQKLAALIKLLRDKFQGKAKSALARAEKGDKQAIETFSNHLGSAMDLDDAFDQQVRTLAQDIQQIIIKVDQGPGQNVQNVFDGGKGTQINHATGTNITGDNNTIHVGS
ncbi:MAG: hypothetical protein AAF572_24845 [Cyanobacteria bacterium P01_B01_bin.77]